jgi:hypothetical protein
MEAEGAARGRDVSELRTPGAGSGCIEDTRKGPLYTSSQPLSLQIVMGDSRNLTVL